ncbi:hypothetical protein WA158_006710 [Blastocystis sp. Blastoise]
MEDHEALLFTKQNNKASQPIQKNTVSSQEMDPDVLLSAYTTPEVIELETDRFLSNPITPSFSTLTVQEEILSNCPYPVGCILQPFHETTKRFPLIKENPHRCLNCGVIMTKLNQHQINQNECKCIICGNITRGSNITEYTESILEPLTELSLDSTTLGTNESNNNQDLLTYSNYCFVDNENISSHPELLSSSSSSSSSKALLFIIDKHLFHEDIQRLLSSLEIVLNQVDDTISIGLLSYGDCIEIYELGNSSLCSADTYRGDRVPQQDDISRILFHEKDPAETYSSYIPPLANGLKPFLNTIKSINGQHNTSYYIKQKPNSLYHRCLGAALSYGMTLINACGCRYGHMIVFTNGPCEIGPGKLIQGDYEGEQDSFKFYKSLAKTAFESHITADIFTSGVDSIGVKTLKNFIYPLGGSIIQLHDWTDDCIQSLSSCLKHAFIPPAMIHLYTSTGVTIKKIIGNSIQQTKEKYRNTILINRAEPSLIYSLLFSLQPRNIYNNLIIQSETHFYSPKFDCSCIYVCSLSIPILTPHYISTYSCQSSIEISPDFYSPPPYNSISSSISRSLSRNSLLSPSSPNPFSNNNNHNNNNNPSSYPNPFSNTNPISNTNLNANTNSSMSTYSNEREDNQILLNKLLSSSSSSSSTTYINQSNSVDPEFLTQQTLRKEASIFYESIQPNIILLLITKDLISQTTWNNKSDIHQTIKYLLKNILSLYRTPNSKNRVSLPDSIQHIPLYLYGFQHSSMLGTWNQHYEDQTISRNRYINAGYEESISLLLPHLYFSRGFLAESNDSFQQSLNTSSTLSSTLNIHLNSFYQRKGSKQYNDIHTVNHGIASTPVSPTPLTTSSTTSLYSPRPTFIHASTQSSSTTTNANANANANNNNNNNNNDNTPSLSSELSPSFSYRSASMSNLLIPPSTITSTSYLNKYPYIIPSSISNNIPNESLTEPSLSSASLSELQQLPTNVLLSQQSPETLALLNNSIIVLDTYEDVYIWIGNDRPSSDKDYLYQYIFNQCVELVDGRYPATHLHAVREFTTESRSVLCRLIPSHQDAVDIINKNHRIFKRLSSLEQKQLLSKFMNTEDYSFRQYMTMINHLE